MLSQNNDKKNLIESMKKLAYYISNNKTRQQEIFHSISADDLKKIIDNLHDDNQYLRRISALLICELFYNNPDLKLKFAEKMNIPLLNGMGRIVIAFPSSLSLKKNNTALIKGYQTLMKSEPKAGEQNIFCWSISLDKKLISIQYYQFKKYSSFTFLDPACTIFGITIGDSQKKQRQNTQTTTSNPLDLLKTEEFTQSALQQRISNKRPSSSNQGKYSISSQNKQKPPSYKKWRQSIPCNANDSARKSTGSSIYSISQYARNSQTYKKQQNRTRQSLSFHDELKQINSSRDHYQSKTNKSVNKSALYETGNNSFQTEKNQSKSRNNNPNHHENFYKKVQEILRK